MELKTNLTTIRHKSLKYTGSIISTRSMCSKVVSQRKLSSLWRHSKTTIKDDDYDMFVVLCLIGKKNRGLDKNDG